MNNLIILRHESTTCTGELTDYAEQRIKKTAGSIKELCRGTYCLNSSKATRALDSAKRLRENLNGKPITLLEELFDEEDYLTVDKAKEIHKIVLKNKNKADNLVLVSHFSVATGYSSYFMQKQFKKIRCIENIYKGQAVLIDIIKEDYQIIP